MELENLLNKAIEKWGLTDSRTVAISQELDKFVVKHQLAYNKLKETGVLDSVITAERVRRRTLEVKELAQRINVIGRVIV